MKSYFEPDMKIIEDWLMDNIMEAEKDLIDESVGWIDIEDERLIFRITGSEFFDEDKCVTDVLKKDFDVIEMLWEWFSDHIEHEDLSPYDMALIESIAKDLNDFASALRKKAETPLNINEPK